MTTFHGFLRYRVVDASEHKFAVADRCSTGFHSDPTHIGNGISAQRLGQPSRGISGG